MRATTTGGKMAASHVTFCWITLLFVASFVSNGHLYMTSHDDAEYCQWETFNATCSHADHVILMTSARYGRMRFGRCMKEDHGSVGCSSDVMSHLDRRCSGRRTCQLQIPDATLHANHPCPKELMPYLEAGYMCIRITGANVHACAVYGGQPLKSESGYLMPGLVHQTTIQSTSSLQVGAVAGTGGSVAGGVGRAGVVAGTAGCPWMIRAKTGQRVNLTIINLDRDTTTSSLSQQIPLKCASQRLVIHDRNRTLEVAGQIAGQNTGGHTGERTLEVAVCNEKRRERHLYLSDGNDVNVYVQYSARYPTTSDTHSMPPFILKYQIVGCPDIPPQENAWIRRQGDTATVRCNHSGETFYITCLETEWKGELTACSRVLPTSSGQKFERSPTFTQGILVVVGIGVALGVSIGVIVLFSVLFCIRRTSRYKEPRQYTADDRLLAAGGAIYSDKYGVSSLLQCSDPGCRSAEHQHVIPLDDLCPYHQHLHLTHLQAPPTPDDSAIYRTSVANSSTEVDICRPTVYQLLPNRTATISGSGRRPEAGGGILAHASSTLYGGSSVARRSFVTFKPPSYSVGGGTNNTSGVSREDREGRDGRDGEGGLVTVGSCTSLDLIKHDNAQQQQQQGTVTDNNSRVVTCNATVDTDIISNANV